jgi:hypothetical protein
MDSAKIATNFDEPKPIQIIFGFLAVLSRRAQQTGHARAPLRGIACGYRCHHRGYRDRQVVAFPSGTRAGICDGLDRPLLYRKEPACHVHLSTLVFHGRLENAGTDADGKTEEVTRFGVR